MSKANLLLSTLLLATWCFGQTDSGASDVSKNTNVRIQGCLSGSPDAYILTDKANSISAYGKHIRTGALGWTQD